MATNYPGALDTTTQLPNDQADATLTDRAGVDHAGEHVNISDSIRAIEGELGIDPSGPGATVKERFQLIPVKAGCRVATTVTGTLATAYNTGDTVDGVVLATGDRILIKDQATASENGVYVVSAGAPVRAADADTASDFAGGMQINVREGTANADSTWRMTTNPPITLGTTALTFVRTDWPAASPWSVLMDGHVNLSAAVAGTYIAHRDETTNMLAAAASPALYRAVMHHFDPADYAITGRTMQMRVVASFAQNAVANAGTSVATAGLYGVNPAGATTTWLPTFDAVIAGSTAARTGGAASSQARVISSAFTAPAADLYTLAVAVTVATTAGSTKIGVRLEYRHV